jgi:hypothetical protein
MVSKAIPARVEGQEQGQEQWDAEQHG